MNKKQVVLSILLVTTCSFTSTFFSKPWKQKAQQIPGRIECEFYDLGGEGVAYHDSDSINNGSGKLNPANGDFLNEFRMKEGVDISFTKSRNIDNHPFNKVEPQLNQLYVGWTQPGEWINYTVGVKKSGTFQVALMYTANSEGTIALDLDGKKLAKQLIVPSTYNARDTRAWRQWHHWNKIDSLTSIKLKKGVHVLTLRTTGHGNMNFDYLEFVKM